MEGSPLLRIMKKETIAAPIEPQQTLPITAPKEIKEMVKSLRLKRRPD
jgi:hypothetical protein